MRDDIWAVPMPRNALGHLIICIPPVRPLPQNLCINKYVTLCVYFYGKNKRSDLKSDSELQQIAENNV